MNTNGLTAAQVAALRNELDTLRYQAMANHESQRGVAFSTAISLLDAACAATVDMTVCHCPSCEPNRANWHNQSVCTCTSCIATRAWIAANKDQFASTAGETASPEPDKDFADRVHHPVDDLPWDIALERRGLKIDPAK